MRLRSHTGCSPCRARKVKCDEVRPRCARCTKRNTSCTYKMEIQPLPVSRNLRRSTKTHDVPDNSISTAPSYQDDTSAADDPACAWTLTPLQMTSTSSDAFGFMETYFQGVAPLLCCYDGDKNPFHYFVAKALRFGSAKYVPLLVATQSLVASFMIRESSSMQQLAWELFQQASERLEGAILIHGYSPVSLFTLIMLAMTATYLDAEGLCSSIMGRIRAAAVNPLPQASNLGAIRSMIGNCEREFFRGNYAWWEMHTLYTSKDYHGHTLDHSHGDGWNESRDSACPHPWTGVAGPVIDMFVQVGRLVRQQRLSSTFQMGSISQERAFKKAECLEEKLLSYTPPADRDVCSPEDSTTPIRHLQCIAEICRQSALLQLYRVFPRILALRLGISCYDHRIEYDSSSHPGRHSTPRTIDQWLFDLAMAILEALSSLPIESRTTPYQAIFLLCISTELRPIDDSIEEHLRVLEARETVLKRLRASQSQIPGGRLFGMFQLLNRTWMRIDQGSVRPGAVWLDVVLDLY